VDLDGLFLDKFAGPTVRERRGPHWRQDGKLSFVTWRQWDSLAREHRESLERERTAWLERHGGLPLHALPEGTRKAWFRLFQERVQYYLDAGYGSCVLRHPEARRIVTDALHHFNNKRYTLGSFAVAANHVHVLVVPFPGIDLSGIQHSWKSWTANAINRAMGTKGRLWRPECHDRLVRDEEELARTTHYILGHARHGHYVEEHPVG